MNIKPTLSVPILDISQLQYSEKYCDDEFEYRHIIIPKEFVKYVPKTHLMTETEWRNLGIQQSPGWIHYMFHGPEPHILMFRRPLPHMESQSEAKSKVTLTSMFYKRVDNAFKNGEKVLGSSSNAFCNDSEHSDNLVELQ